MFLCYVIGCFYYWLGTRYSAAMFYISLLRHVLGCLGYWPYTSTRYSTVTILVHVTQL